MARLPIDHDVPQPSRRVLMAAAALGLGAVHGVLRAAAPGAPLHIACLASTPPHPANLTSFLAALTKLDPALAARTRFTTDFAHFDATQLRQLARKLNEQGPALILCFDFDAAVAVVATRVSAGVPMVFRAHDDPLAFGLIDSYARPGHNLTGITTYRCLDQKLVEIIRDAVPTARRIGFVHDGAIADAGCNAQARNYAAGRDIRLLDFSVSSAEQLPALLDRIGRQAPDALIVAATAVSWPMRQQIIARMDALTIPAIYEGQVFVDDGGLMQFSALQDDAFDRMARAAAHVLRGGAAGDFPVSQPVHFELVINLRARHASHYRLSPQILRRADRIVE